MSHHPLLPQELRPPHSPWSSSGPGEEAGVLPLRAGDHLTLEEFERRYRAMPEETKAELINGVVYMASPSCAGCDPLRRIPFLDCAPSLSPLACLQVGAKPR